MPSSLKNEITHRALFSETNRLGAATSWEDSPNDGTERTG